VITHVALKLADGEVFALPSPARHGNLFREYNDDPEVIAFAAERGLVSFEGQGLVKGMRLNARQGFLVDGTTYVDRIAGAAHALGCGQILKLSWPPNLFSEDLW